ncbi:MAG: glycosyltransferase family 4 protein [Chloroflexota bacterium]
MHILFVTHYYEPDSGAAAVQLTRLAKALQARGHKITVLTTLPHYPQREIDPAYRGKFTVSEERDGIRVIRSWLWTRPGASIAKRLLSQLTFMVSASVRGLSLPRPDVVFIEYQPIFTGVAGRLLADLKRAPYVLDVSDLWPDHLLTVGVLDETDTVYKVARAVVDAGYRGAAHIITLSPTWQEKVAQYAPQMSDDITTILYGVDTKRLSPQPADAVATFTAQHNLDPDKLWVSFLGTFSTPYNFPLMLDIAAHFADRDDVGFVYIGAGTQQAVVDERVAQGDIPNVRMIEWVEYEQMPLAWGASTIIYWALRDEPLYDGTIPAKLYEATACGVPIVAAQRGHAIDMIREAQAGMVFEPQDKAGMIKATEKLLADPDLRRQYSENGRAYALAHFDKEVIADQYAAILEMVAQHHKAKSS